MSGGKVKNM